MTVGIQRCHNPGWMQSVARWHVLDQYTANAENGGMPIASNFSKMPSSRPMAFGTQLRKKSSANGSMKQFASIVPGHTDLCAALDNQSHARRSALSNLRGRLLNVALKRFFAIIVIKGAQ